jgi:pantothenate kinase-related protein Tda10
METAARVMALLRTDPLIQYHSKDDDVPTPRFCKTYFHQKGDRGRVAQWLRRCATNREVAGSIPGGVIGIFH